MARSFDGSNDYVIDNGFSWPSYPFAFGVCFYPRSLPTGGATDVVVQLHDTTEYFGVKIEFDDSNFDVAYEGDANWVPINSTIAPAQDTWNVVIVTATAADDWVADYWNGTSSDQNSSSTDAGLITTDRFVIGASVEASDPIGKWMDGLVADFFMIDVTPTADQIAAYFKFISPELIWPGALLECKRFIKNINGETGDRGLITLTNNGSTEGTTHPPTIYPSRRSIFVPAAVAAGARPQGPLSHPLSGPFGGPI